MIISITEIERLQRLDKVRQAIIENGYSAMLFAADSYLGKKGSLRYLFDNHLIHRYGYGLVFPDGQYQILPSGLHWCTDRRVPDTVYPADHEILEVVRRFRQHGVEQGTVGVVGLNHTMKIEDYLHLQAELPNVVWKDASVLFDTIRAVKSENEIEGIIETNRIIEAGFDQIVDHIQIGMTEEEAVSVCYRTVHAMGAKDTLFLTLSSDEPGAVEPYFLNPRPKVIKQDDYLIVSLEITGPTGHWVEHSRMFRFGEADPETEKLAAVVAEGLAYAEKAMKPGVKVTDVQEGLEEIASRHGYRCGHLSGHGIGMDVIERPFVAKQSKTTFVGVEVPGKEDESLQFLREGMVISFHPQIVHQSGKKSAYMSDVFVIRSDRAERLSKRGHEVIAIGNNK